MFDSEDEDVGSSGCARGRLTIMRWRWWICIMEGFSMVARVDDGDGGWRDFRRVSELLDEMVFIGKWFVV